MSTFTWSSGRGGNTGTSGRTTGRGDGALGTGGEAEDPACADTGDSAGAEPRLAGCGAASDSGYEQVRSEVMQLTQAGFDSSH